MRIYPKGVKSLYNIYSAIFKYLGIDSDYPANRLMYQLLNEEDYTNIVILFYDGLSNDIIGGSLSTNKVLEYQSVFSSEESSIDDIRKVFSDNLDKTLYGIFPDGIGAYSKEDEAYNSIGNLCSNDKKKIIFAYFNELMKLDNDELIANKLNYISEQVLKLYNEITNSLIIVLGTKGIKGTNCLLPLIVYKKKIEKDIIRKSIENDYQQLRDVFKNIQVSRYNEKKELFSKVNPMSRVEFSNICGGVNGYSCFVYERCGKILGFIVIKINSFGGKQVYNDISYISIEGIFVLEDYRRRGIGSKLYEETVKYAKKLMIKKVLFSVWYFDTTLLKFIDSLNFNELLKTYEMNL